MDVIIPLLFVVTIILFYFLKPKSLKGKLLPGPPGWPIIGSALSVNECNGYKVFSEYAKQYGDIFRVNMLGQNVVCLNTAELIKKAFCDERYKRYFSDRPSMFYSENILFGCQSIGFYKEGFSNVHADMRKGLAKGLHVYGDGMPVFEERVMGEVALQLLKIEDFKGKEFDFVALIKRTLSNLVAILLNGESLKDDDQDVDMFWEFDRGFDFMVGPSVNTTMVVFPFLRYLPGIYKDRYNDLKHGKERLTQRYFTDVKLNGESLKDDDQDVDMFWEFDRGFDFMVGPSVNTTMVVFPFLRYLPGIYKDRYNDLKHGKERLTQRYFTDVKETYVPGQVRGLIDYIVGEQRRQEEAGQEVVFTDERIICLVLETVGAGILTSLSTMCSMMLCLLHHPEYQMKIQQELDDVVGRDRLPTIGDRSNCPIFEAVAMETQRYITVAPLLLPHYCPEHVVFEGYDIQPKTMMTPNAWFVHHDEKVWGDPWVFRPERFLDDNGQIVPNDHHLRKSWIPFSIGRRQCPGESLARSRLFLYIATMLHKFKFVPSRDKCGSCDPRLDEQFDIAGTCRPKPFFCKAEPR